MKNAWKAVLLIGFVTCFATSCSLLPQGVISKGELRLVNIHLPDVIQEDLPYDVIVTFDSEEKPQIKKVCFRWLSEMINSVSPSLYCYAMDVETNQQAGSSCSRWLAQGEFAQASPSFCVEGSEVRFESSERFFVKVHFVNVKLFYNKLECYVQYVQDGAVKETNKVTTRIKVEQ